MARLDQISPKRKKTKKQIFLMIAKVLFAITFISLYCWGSTLLFNKIFGLC